MKGVLIRPLRLVRRAVAVTALFAVLAACGAFKTPGANAPEALRSAREWGERAWDALAEALPRLGEEAKERVVPALAEAAGYARELLAPYEDADDADGADGVLEEDEEDEAVEEDEEDEAVEEDDTTDGPESARQDANGEPILRRNADDAALTCEASDEPVILRRSAEARQKLALTFDDGPHPTHTAPILDLLAKYGAKATFFVIGENAAAHPELIAREIAEGHEVANHTMTHAALSRLSYRDALREVLDAEHAIFPDGAGSSTLLRPPCGAIGQSVMRVAERLGLSLVLWSVDTRDWEHKSADAIVETVRKGVTGGDVILFHDFVSGETHTLEALETLIPELASEGYEFVTVSELFGPE